VADADSSVDDEDHAPKQRARDMNFDELERAANITGNASKNWFWALIGVVVIAGGVTAGVMLSHGGSNDRALPTRAPTFPTPEPTPEPTYPPTPWPVTEQATDDPTPDPTTPLTNFPTISIVTERPTDEPTLDPTDFPTPTFWVHTESPTPPLDDDAFSVTNEFMSGLPPYSLELAENVADSPQAKALAWIQNDPLYSEYELHRLNQRYALAVFYYSTNGDSSKNNSGWLSGASESTWYITSIRDEFSSDMIDPFT
jgi:hypothetical protein